MPSSTPRSKARLVDTNQISANHIKVVTERGITYLMGIVSDREARVAIAVARTTAGVRKVVNIMEIIPTAKPSASTRNPR
jgi:osmotically-inducible protein OsmY